MIRCDKEGIDGQKLEYFSYDNKEEAYAAGRGDG
jgi:hypothetical protein